MYVATKMGQSQTLHLFLNVCDSFCCAKLWWSATELYAACPSTRLSHAGIDSKLMTVGTSPGNLHSVQKKGATGFFAVTFTNIVGFS